MDLAARWSMVALLLVSMAIPRATRDCCVDPGSCRVPPPQTKSCCDKCADAPADEDAGVPSVPAGGDSRCDSTASGCCAKVVFPVAVAGATATADRVSDCDFPPELPPPSVSVFGIFHPPRN